MTITRISRLFALVSTLVLLGCQTSQPKAYEISPPKLIQAPVRVLNEAIGMSFDLTTNDAVRMGFQKVTADGAKNISEWNLKSQSPDSEWNMKKIVFTPLTGKVYSFSATRFYGASTQAELECQSDYHLIQTKINNQYRSLRNVTFIKNEPGKIFNTLLCEGEARAPLFDHGFGRGRCVSVMCLGIPGNESSRLIGSALEVEYHDQDLDEILADEKKSYLRDNQDQILRARGITPSQF